MTEFLNDLNKKSDEELIAIANGKIPYFLSGKSTTTRQDVIIEAKSLLHKRKSLSISNEKKWYKKPSGIVVLGAAGSLLAWIILWFLRLV
jgi:hypothetical protein